MRNKAAVFAASLLASVCLAPAFAQDGDAPLPASQPAEDENFTDNHLALARDVIDLLRADEQFDTILPQLATRTQELFTQSNPSLTAEIEDAVMGAALDLAPRRVELSRTQELIWARRFTEPQLVELKTFLQTDTGRAFAETSPVIAALFIGAARQWEQELATAMVEATRAKLREAGVQL